MCTQDVSILSEAVAPCEMEKKREREKDRWMRKKKKGMDPEAYLIGPASLRVGKVSTEAAAGSP